MVKRSSCMVLRSQSGRLRFYRASLLVLAHSVPIGAQERERLDRAVQRADQAGVGDERRPDVDADEEDHGERRPAHGGPRERRAVGRGVRWRPAGVDEHLRSCPWYARAGAAASGQSSPPPPWSSEPPPPDEPEPPD